MTTAALATLNGTVANGVAVRGVVVTTCRIQIPAWGLWWAEVECASQEPLVGRATLVLDDVTFVGTIVTGGAYETRTRYRIVGGFGGWGRTLGAKAYRADNGVKRAAVLLDAATECGETLGTVPASSSVGLAFARSRGPASRVLEDLVPRGWYVDADGVTQVGRRPAVAWAGAATRMVSDSAQGRIELAPSTLVGLVPGAIVDGVEAVDIEHVLDGEGKLRTTIWGRGVSDSARLPDAFRRIVESFTAGHRYFAPWEYRVVYRSGDRLNLQATRVSSGMPDLLAVPVRAGGVRARVGAGSLVLVSFVNGDPGWPVVTNIASVDDYAGGGAILDELVLTAGASGTAAGAIEHATSAESLALAVQTTLNTIGTAITAGGGPAGYLGATISALAVDATFAAGVLAAIAGGTLGPATKLALNNALAAKTADTGGDTPGLGWPAVRGG